MNMRLPVFFIIASLLSAISAGAEQNFRSMASGASASSTNPTIRQIGTDRTSLPKGYISLDTEHCLPNTDFIPVPGDYTGDGISDLAVMHKQTETWFILALDGRILLWDGHDFEEPEQ